MDPVQSYWLGVELTVGFLLAFVGGVVVGWLVRGEREKKDRRRRDAERDQHSRIESRS